jgi:hypothetical protein
MPPGLALSRSDRVMSPVAVGAEVFEWRAPRLAPGPEVARDDRLEALAGRFPDDCPATLEVSP